MFSRVSKKVTALVIVAVMAIGLGIGWLATRGQAQPPGALPEGAIVIPQDLLPKFNDSLSKIKAAQKEQAVIEQVFRITLDRAGVAPEKFGEYRLDEEKKALVKAPKQ